MNKASKTRLQLAPKGAPDGCLALDELQTALSAASSLPANGRIATHLRGCALCREALEGYAAAAADGETSMPAMLNAGIRNKFGRRQGKLWALAAAALLLFAVAWPSYTSLDFAAQNARLYQMYFDPYPDLVPRLRSATPGRELAGALEQYDAGNDILALAMFENATLSDESGIAWLYAGLTHLKLDQPDRALRYFAVLDTTGVPRVQSAATWYEALAWLKKGDRRRTASRARRVVLLGGTFAEEARQLVTTLDETVSDRREQGR